MAEPAVQTRRLTFEEAALLDPDTQAGELIEGEWTPVTRATARHGKVAAKVVRILGRYLDAHPVGEVLTGDPGMKLSGDPDTLRGPDVAFIAQERVPPDGIPDEWWQGAPDLAVEVQSKNQSVSDLAAKALEYLQAGASVVWVLDPRPRRVMVFTPPNQIRILGPEETLDGGDVLPGFACKVSEFFE